MLLEHRRLPIWGKNTPVELEVTQFSLSNHAGHAELAKFARECSPKHVVLFHADAEPAMALAEELGSEMEVHIPENGKSLTIR